MAIDSLWNLPRVASLGTAPSKPIILNLWFVFSCGRAVMVSLSSWFVFISRTGRIISTPAVSQQGAWPPRTTSQSQPWTWTKWNEGSQEVLTWTDGTEVELGHGAGAEMRETVTHTWSPVVQTAPRRYLLPLFPYLCCYVRDDSVYLSASLSGSGASWFCCRSAKAEQNVSEAANEGQSQLV